MKIFEFEQRLKKKYIQVNIIYKNRNNSFTITTLKGRSSLSEVENEKIVYYNSIEELMIQSEQYLKYIGCHTFIVDTSKSTDAANWIVTQLFNIELIKKELNIDNTDLAEMFNYKNANSFATSSAYRRILNGLVSFYKLTKEGGKK